MLVHVVADYGVAADLAFAEVAQRLAAALPAVTLVSTTVGPFDTLAAGFVVAQLALSERPGERLVFHNVAPRRGLLRASVPELRATTGNSAAEPASESLSPDAAEGLRPAA